MSELLAGQVPLQAQAAKLLDLLLALLITQDPALQHLLDCIILLLALGQATQLPLGRFPLGLECVMAPEQMVALTVEVLPIQVILLQLLHHEVQLVQPGLKPQLWLGLPLGGNQGMLQRDQFCLLHAHDGLKMVDQVLLQPLLILVHLPF